MPGYAALLLAAAALPLSALDPPQRGGVRVTVQVEAVVLRSGSNGSDTGGMAPHGKRRLRPHGRSTIEFE